MNSIAMRRRAGWRSRRRCGTQTLHASSEVVAAMTAEPMLEMIAAGIGGEADIRKISGVRQGRVSASEFGHRLRRFRRGGEDMQRALGA